MGKAVGIDLGTTNSVVAHMRKKEAKIINNQDDDPLTPSVVHIDDYGEVVVGKMARSLGGKSPENTVYSIKRFMGREYKDPEVQKDINNVPYKVLQASNGETEVALRNKRYSPHEISAFILESLKSDAQASLDEEVTHAVITVPAYFGSRQREVTRLAGQLSGLKVMRIIPEPTAAALAYGFESDMDEPKTILVYDLGGGTFDVTVMFIASGLFEDQGKTGDMHLGGDNFDALVANWLMDQVRIQKGVNLRDLPNFPEISFTLKQKAEEAKIRLSKQTRVPIVIPGLARVNGRLVDVECELSRDSFNQMIQPYVKRSVDLVYEAISLAKTRPEDIDHILLVGGSTRVPLVEETLRGIFKDKVIRGEINPMHCVAQGAAIQTLLVDETDDEDAPTVECDNCGALNPSGRQECRACGKSLTGFGIGIDVVQRIPKPIGVQTMGDVMEVILDTGMPYPSPSPVSKTLKTTSAGQELVRLPIYEGFDSVASKNELLGEVQGNLPSGLPIRTNVIVSLSIDADGILYTTASLPDRPGVKIEAKLKRGETPPIPPPPPPTPDDWKAEAQFVLFKAAAIKDESGPFLPPNALDPMMQKSGQLLLALQTNDERNGRSLMTQLEEEVEKFGLFVMLGMMRVITQNPEISSKVGYAKIDELARYVARADRAKSTRDLMGFKNAVDEAMPLFEEIMQILMKDGDLLGGLLAGSTSFHN